MASTTETQTKPETKTRLTKMLERAATQMAVVTRLETALEQPYLPYYAIDQMEGDLLHERLYLGTLLGDLIELGPQPEETAEQHAARKKRAELECRLVNNATSIASKYTNDHCREVLWRERKELKEALAAL